MCVIGLDIGGSWVRAAISDGQSIIAKRSARWLDTASAETDIILITQLITDLQHEIADPIRSIGVSLAASLDMDGRVVGWPNRPDWCGIPFKAILQDRFNVPITIDDDANAAALAEYVYGAGRGYDQMLFVIAGTGIGGGLIINGKLFRGRNGWAGELGHQIVQVDGVQCSCGKRGCVQTLAGGRWLDHLAIVHHLHSAADLPVAASQGYDWALDALSDAGRWLGIAVANVVNLLDMEVVVVGGGLSQLGGVWWSALTQTIIENLYNQGDRQLIIKRSEIPEGAGLLGAISLAL